MTKRNPISSITAAGSAGILTATALEWRQAADDVHVATLGGEFSGYIAAGPDGLALHDAHSAPLGVFATLAEAQGALRLAAPAAHRPARKRRHRRSADAEPRPVIRPPAARHERP